MAGLNLKAETIIANQTTATETNLVSGLAKAWANLNGDGTIAERSSLNISGYVDNGTGDYTHTISNDMANANYIVTFGASDTGITDAYANIKGTSFPAAGSYDVYGATSTTGTFTDLTWIASEVNGDLA